MDPLKAVLLGIPVVENFLERFLDKKSHKNLEVSSGWISGLTPERIEPVETVKIPSKIQGKNNFWNF